MRPDNFSTCAKHCHSPRFRLPKVDVPSRSTTSAKLTYLFTFAGNFLGGSLVMIFGATLATVVPNAVNDAGVATASLFGPFQIVAYIVLVLSVLQINVLNVYSTYMSVTSIFTGFKNTVSLSGAEKLLLIGSSAGISTVIAVATRDDFFVFFSNMLIGQLYLLVPWSAINLTDFYLVRRNGYSVVDLYRLDGIYGRFNPPGLLAYAAAILAQIPFMGFSFYYGPVYQMIGADVAWVVGLAVPAVVYYVSMKARRVDLIASDFNAL